MKQGLGGPCFFCLLFLVGEHLGDEVEELKNSLQLWFLEVAFLCYGMPYGHAG